MAKKLKRLNRDRLITYPAREKASVELREILDVPDREDEVVEAILLMTPANDVSELPSLTDYPSRKDWQDARRLVAREQRDRTIELLESSSPEIVVKKEGTLSSTALVRASVKVLRWLLELPQVEGATLDKIVKVERGDGEVG